MTVGNGKTFDQFCFTRRVTKKERKALAWHLATLRARRLIERPSAMIPDPLLEAARFERDRRAATYPDKIRGGADNDALSIDAHCWVALAEWLETGRFASFEYQAASVGEGGQPTRTLSWPELEAAAAKALASVGAKIVAMEADPRQERREPNKRISPVLYAEHLADACARRWNLIRIHRRVQLRRQMIDSINAEFRVRRRARAAEVGQDGPRHKDIAA